LLLDRGFRDCIDKLIDDFNLNPKMPSFLNKDQTQCTTEQANQSRFITKCRWVVEVINAFLKRSFKALSQTSNKSLPHLMKDYRIAGALINKYFKRLYSDDVDEILIVSNMKSRLNQTNHLQTLIETNKLHLKNAYNTLECSEIEDFPRIHPSVIKHQITLGSYQLDQSLSYLAEHFKCDIKLNKSYEFSIENPPWLLIDTEPDSTLRYNSLPSFLNVSNRSYQFICCTIHHGIHFRAIFHLNNKDFLVDDLYPDTLKESTPRDRINVSIYFLV
jgi:hypothetical protein